MKNEKREKACESEERCEYPVANESGEESMENREDCKTVKCPKCGKQNVTKLDWEKAVPEMNTEQITTKKILLAGICMQKQLPRYVCKDCKTYF